MDFFETIMFPFKWLVSAIMVVFHDGLSAIGMPAANGWTWTLSIIGLVLVIRAALIPVFVKQIKAQRGMQLLQPDLKKLQDKYKGKTDQLSRQAMAQEQMAMYKKHGTNPFSACLPMLIQMPVFLAFYWVLLESVEMRQAPFLGWINDLSARDPFFILPALNGLAMWGQYKLNPPPPDPVQAKVFQFMPIVFSVMFALFPAGLVLYWVTNTGLSILQQWNINRTIAAEDKARKK